MRKIINPAMIGRRGAVIAAAGLFLPAIARANEWPTRPIRMVVPLPPDGGTDNLGRMFAQALGERLGQTVIVENRGGAGGNIGSAAVAAATHTAMLLLLHRTHEALDQQRIAAASAAAAAAAEREREQRCQAEAAAAGLSITLVAS